jgi:hypothetical protein
MSYRSFCSLALAASLVAGFFFVSKTAAQNGASVAKPSCIGCSTDGKTTPRTPDGHPDLSGFWGGGALNSLISRTGDGSVLFDFGGENVPTTLRLDANGQRLPDGAQDAPARRAQPSEPSYKPEYMAKVKAIADSWYGHSTPEDPQMDCKPLGVPRGTAGSMHIVQTPQVVAILYEESPGPIYRIIYLDGRPHPKDLDTSFSGDSIGHWDGDALVVDVAGLNDETWLGVGGYAVLHSDQEHVIERYTRDANTLTYEATVEDPVMFTKPWVITPRKFPHGDANDALIEAICAGHDKSHFVKPTPEDSYICNYCSQATRTPGTGLATPATAP